MIGTDEKRIVHLAERKGFRLEKMGGGDERFYLIDIASGGKIPSDAPGHPYSFSLLEVKAWLEARAWSGAGPGFS